MALYGFAVAAMWISLFASEIVELLHFLGVLSGVDPGILGLTVSAGWVLLPPAHRGHFVISCCKALLLTTLHLVLRSPPAHAALPRGEDTLCAVLAWLSLTLQC